MGKLNIFITGFGDGFGLCRSVLSKTSRACTLSSWIRRKKREIQLEQDYARLKLEQARLANHKLIKVAAEKATSASAGCA